MAQMIKLRIKSERGGEVMQTMPLEEGVPYQTTVVVGGVRLLVELENKGFTRASITQTPPAQNKSK